jgi:predicted XRE-type DNA-binding protein
MPNPNGRPLLTFEEAYDSFVSRINKTETCWLWDGMSGAFGKTKMRYGLAWYQGKPWRAHRLAYYLFNGENPGDLFVCHSCDTPMCVNPSHLRLGTHQDNMNDMKERGRRKGKGKCFGENNSNAKLTQADADTIRNLYKEGKMNQTEIAMKYNVHQSTISKIVRGERFTET